MKTLALAAAALGLVVTSIPATAAAYPPLTMRVKTSDLNLATAAGQTVLDQRIEAAVRTVCRVTNPNTGARVMNHSTRACLAKARAEARQQIAMLKSVRQRGG
ncbi:MAG: UrcA family protein [Erythrobacter sp.]